MPRIYHGYRQPHDRDTYSAATWCEVGDGGVSWQCCHGIDREGRTVTLARTNYPGNAVVGQVAFLDMASADLVCGSPAAMHKDSRVQGAHYFVVTGFFTASGERIPESPHDQCFVQLLALTSKETDFKLSPSEKVRLFNGEPPSVTPIGDQFLDVDSYVHVLPDTTQVMHVPTVTLAKAWVPAVQVTLTAVRTINEVICASLPNDDERELLYAVYAAKHSEVVGAPDEDGSMAHPEPPPVLDSTTAEATVCDDATPQPPQQQR